MEIDYSMYVVAVGGEPAVGPNLGCRAAYPGVRGPIGQRGKPLFRMRLPVHKVR